MRKSSVTECLLSPPGHGTLQQDADHELAAERKAFQEVRGESLMAVVS